MVVSMTQRKSGGRKVVGADGFTLIELLVVISIISVLIAVMLPSLGAARAAARSVQCLSSQRQIGLATLMYVDGNRGYLPPTTMLTGNGSNFITVANLLIRADYLPFDVPPVAGGTGGGTRAFVCPDGPDPYSATSSQGAYGLVYVHYGYNYAGLGGYQASKNVPMPHIDQLLTGASTYMFMDAVTTSAFDKGSYRVFHRTSTSTGIPDARHGQALNIVYVDGHAAGTAIESVLDPWATIGNWNDDRWWGGRNPVW